MVKRLRKGFRFSALSGTGLGYVSRGNGSRMREHRFILFFLVTAPLRKREKKKRGTKEVVCVVGKIG